MRKIETFASASLKTEVRGERIEVRKPRSLRSSNLSPQVFALALKSTPSATAWYHPVVLLYGISLFRSCSPRTGPCSGTKVEGRFFCSSRSYQTLDSKPQTRALASEVNGSSLFQPLASGLRSRSQEHTLRHSVVSSRSAPIRDLAP